MAPKATVEDEASLRPRLTANVPPATRQNVTTPPSTDYQAHMGMANLRGGLGTREQIQDELDEIAQHLRSFYLKAPDQVMVECSAYTARLTELCVLLCRVEGLDKQYLRVRTMQVERYLAELDRQFKISSRLVEVARQDLALSGAQV